MKKSKLRKIFRVIKWVLSIFILFLLVECIRPTWTPNIKGEDSVSELSKVSINGTKLEVMVRGKDIDNPVIIFVHGGPSCSEIPYIRKYQDLLEQKFTIVHYDQRGSGKSYQFGENYKDLTAATHIEDLLALTDYIEKKLGKDRVILMGHSYGTYIATIAASRAPEKYSAYVGIGQMSDTNQSELEGLHTIMNDAKGKDNKEDYTYLESLEERIMNGEMITPRDYVRKYGHAARLIDENSDYIKGFLWGSEYNLFDGIKFFIAAGKSQDALIKEALDNPVTQIVDTLDVPVYFVMGKYDCMTSPKAAENYLNSINSTKTKEIKIFEESAHYPHLEEKEAFYEWMCDTFKIQK
jgi:pimeloyl-ACP methyl ester carboxylesterase